MVYAGFINNPCNGYIYYVFARAGVSIKFKVGSRLVRVADRTNKGLLLVTREVILQYKILNNFKYDFDM